MHVDPCHPSSDRPGRPHPRRAWLRSAVALGLLPLLPGCKRPSPEQALRDTIAAMVQAVEARDVKALLDHVAGDFTRNSGGLDRKQVRSLLLGIFLRTQKIHGVTTIREVKVDGDRGQVRLNLLATGGAGLLPERGRLWDISSGWRRDGGDWKLFNAEWSD